VVVIVEPQVRQGENGEGKGPKGTERKRKKNLAPGDSPPRSFRKVGAYVAVNASQSPPSVLDSAVRMQFNCYSHSSGLTSPAQCPTHPAPLIMDARRPRPSAARIPCRAFACRNRLNTRSTCQRVIQPTGFYILHVYSSNSCNWHRPTDILRHLCMTQASLTSHTYDGHVHRRQRQGRSDGGVYRYLYPQKSAQVNFYWVKMTPEPLFNSFIRPQKLLYSPKQIYGYAPGQRPRGHRSPDPTPIIDLQGSINVSDPCNNSHASHIRCIVFVNIIDCVIG